MPQKSGCITWGFVKGIPLLNKHWCKLYDGVLVTKYVALRTWEEE